MVWRSSRVYFDALKWQKTMDECVQDLTKQLTNQLKFTTPRRWPAKKTYDELAAMHLTMMSTKTIVQIIGQI